MLVSRCTHLDAGSHVVLAQEALASKDTYAVYATGREPGAVGGCR